ncbi:twin-arginine translocase TatA/TatE family subunit [Pseudomonas sp. SCB32]|uniref:twin-arginine translocase TatA/TatE family subunit n=1 Tax=Pseudomonas sp. SCB32 TaxID=2653853 RepID=UPI001264DADC|nr:twin-arginine translocase TatA/TatE family subunit [Pseudomonas sp. SCB32]
MGLFDWKHWLVLLAVVVLVFGTRRLKNVGADLGEAIKGFRRSIAEEETPEPPVQAVRQVVAAELDQGHSR